jgi:hypothetical protein
MFESDVIRCLRKVLNAPEGDVVAAAQALVDGNALAKGEWEAAATELKEAIDARDKQAQRARVAEQEVRKLHESLAAIREAMQHGGMAYGQIVRLVNNAIGLESQPEPENWGVWCMNSTVSGWLKDVLSKKLETTEANARDIVADVTHPLKIGMGSGWRYRACKLSDFTKCGECGGLDGAHDAPCRRTVVG